MQIEIDKKPMQSRSVQQRVTLVKIAFIVSLMENIKIWLYKIFRNMVQKLQNLLENISMLK